MKYTAICATVAAALLYQPVVHAETSELNTLKLRINQLEQRLDATASALDESAGKKSSATTLGGYGEVHYNNWDSKKEINLRRFVLFIGHQFNDRIRFHSEFEVTHTMAGESSTDFNKKKGFVSVEQAFIDLQLNDRHTFRSGLFLMPVGILNETHEPTTFYGVERNMVETHIIPTTWWEGGLAMTGKVAPALSYDVALTSGLNTPTSGADNFVINKSRQFVSQAKANSPAYTGRLRWSGIPGVSLSATLHRQDDLTQDSMGLAATLAETHAIVQRGDYGLRALYAQWNLDGNAPKAVGRDKQYGWYLEPSYRVSEKLGVFARYSLWDTQAGDSADSKNKQTNIGVNYWAHPQVVYKADIQRRNNRDDGFNLGVGYHF